MTLPIFGLLLVTLSALGLSVWVFMPSNKSYFDSVAKLAIAEETTHEDA